MLPQWIKLSWYSTSLTPHLIRQSTGPEQGYNELKKSSNKKYNLSCQTTKRTEWPCAIFNQPLLSTSFHTFRCLCTCIQKIRSASNLNEFVQKQWTRNEALWIQAQWVLTFLATKMDQIVKKNLKKAWLSLVYFFKMKVWYKTNVYVTLQFF